MKRKNKKHDMNKVGEIYEIDLKNKAKLKKNLKKVKENKIAFRTLGVDKENKMIVKDYYPPEDPTNSLDK